VPAQLDWITAQLLAKDPEARPPSAAAARAGLLTALNPDSTALLTAPGDRGDLAGPGAGGRRRPTQAEILLAVALIVVSVALAAVLLTGTTGQAGPSAATGASHHPSVTPSVAHKTHKKARGSMGAGQLGALPPAAAAAATLVGELEAGVADGQVTPQAGEDLYNHLQQLLFGSPRQDPQQIQHQYAQLMQTYDQRRSQGQITGRAATAVRHALRALGAAVGAA
jgi:hypothetical protein